MIIMMKQVFTDVPVCVFVCVCVCVCVAEQDHEVQEEKIMLVSLLMAELGVHSVAYAFPKVKIITTAVDKSLDDNLHVIPGIGKTTAAAPHSLHSYTAESEHICLTVCPKWNRFACFKSLSLRRALYKSQVMMFSAYTTVSLSSRK